MFTKEEKVADVYQKRGEIRRTRINWIAVSVVVFVGLLIIGAIT
jgi:hypothetical protein